MPRRARFCRSRRLGVARAGRSGSVALVALLMLLAAATGAAVASRAGSRTATQTIPGDVVALAREATLGGKFMLEVDAAGRVIAYSASVDLAKVPAVCRSAADAAAPGGKTVGATREVIDGRSYWEIEKDVDGLKVEILTTPAGKVAGSEIQLRADQAPAHVVTAANRLMPAGDLVSVERVEGPETLGAPEHHVKKLVNGELIRIRVTEAGAVEQLRKLRSELKVPR